MSKAFGAAGVDYSTLNDNKLWNLILGSLIPSRTNVVPTFSPGEPPTIIKEAGAYNQFDMTAPSGYDPNGVQIPANSGLFLFFPGRGIDVYRCSRVPAGTVDVIRNAPPLGSLTDINLVRILYPGWGAGTGGAVVPTELPQIGYDIVSFTYNKELILPYSAQYQPSSQVQITPPLAEQFARTRFISGGFSIVSETISAGNIPLTGEVSAAVLADTTDIAQDDNSEAFSIAQCSQACITRKDAIEGIKAFEGIVTIAGPDVQQALAVPDKDILDYTNGDTALSEFTGPFSVALQLGMLTTTGNPAQSGRISYNASNWSPAIVSTITFFQVTIPGSSWNYADSSPYSPAVIENFTNPFPWSFGGNQSYWPGASFPAYVSSGQNCQNVGILQPIMNTWVSPWDTEIAGGTWAKERQFSISNSGPNGVRIPPPGLSPQIWNVTPATSPGVQPIDECGMFKVRFIADVAINLGAPDLSSGSNQPPGQAVACALYNVVVAATHVFAAARTDGNVQYNTFYEVRKVAVSSLDAFGTKIDVSFDPTQFRRGFTTTGKYLGTQIYLGAQPLYNPFDQMTTQGFSQTPSLVNDPRWTRFSSFAGAIRVWKAPRVYITATTINVDGNVGPCHIVQYKGMSTDTRLTFKGRFNVVGVAEAKLAPYVQTSIENTSRSGDLNMNILLGQIYDAPTTTIRRNWARGDYDLYIAEAVGTDPAEQIMNWASADPKNVGATASGLFSALGRHLGGMASQLHPGLGGLGAALGGMAGGMADQYTGMANGQFGVGATGQFGVGPMATGQFGAMASGDFGGYGGATGGIATSAGYALDPRSMMRRSRQTF
jgi:hypothetical protein